MQIGKVKKRLLVINNTKPIRILSREVFIYISLFISLFIYLLIYLFIYLSIYLFIYVFIHLLDGDGRASPQEQIRHFVESQV